MKNNLFSLSEDPLPILRIFSIIAGFIVILTVVISPVQAQTLKGFCTNNSEESHFTNYLMNSNRKDSEKLAKSSEINGRQVVEIAPKVKEIGLNKVEKTEDKAIHEAFATSTEKNTLDEQATNEANEVKPDKIVFSVITAYTSTPGQTDSDPFTAASGKHVYDGMIAANGLPFGTKIKIPELYGDKIFTVDDRMNKRYGFGRMDIWLDTTVAEARKFGVKRVNVEIYYVKAEVKTIAAVK